MIGVSRMPRLPSYAVRQYTKRVGSSRSSNKDGPGLPNLSFPQGSGKLMFVAIRRWAKANLLAIANQARGCGLMHQYESWKGKGQRTPRGSDKVRHARLMLP